MKPPTSRLFNKGMALGAVAGAAAGLIFALLLPGAFPRLCGAAASILPAPGDSVLTDVVISGDQLEMQAISRLFHRFQYADDSPPDLTFRGRFELANLNLYLVTGLLVVGAWPCARRRKAASIPFVVLMVAAAAATELGIVRAWLEADMFSRAWAQYGQGIIMSPQTQATADSLQDHFDRLSRWKSVFPGGSRYVLAASAAALVMIPLCSLRIRRPSRNVAGRKRTEAP